MQTGGLLFVRPSHSSVGRVSEFRYPTTPDIQRARVRDASALDITIRASWRGWSVVGAAAAASWSQWVGRTVSGYMGTLNFRF